MASSLIDTMTEDFEPSAYHDSYREAIQALVEAKIAGNEVISPTGQDQAPTAGAPADLAETLRASVAAARAARSDAPRAAADGDSKPAATKKAPAKRAPAKRASAKDKDTAEAKPASRRRASA
jgi:DNA end-binding protein Ku